MSKEISDTIDNIIHTLRDGHIEEAIGDLESLQRSLYQEKEGVKMDEQDPYPPVYYVNQKVGDSNQERFDHFQSQLDKWNRLRAPRKTPKHLRVQFMKQSKELIEKARDFYKGQLLKKEE